MKILLAEDDFVTRKFMANFLSKYGDCDVTVDGMEAVDAYMMALEDDDPYDLVCLDIMMPVMVDESHSAGVVGATGHGVSELYQTYGRVDIYTGTLGKAFGGAMGGFTTGRKEIIDLQRWHIRLLPQQHRVRIHELSSLPGAWP